MHDRIATSSYDTRSMTKLSGGVLLRVVVRMKMQALDYSTCGLVLEQPARTSTRIYHVSPLNRGTGTSMSRSATPMLRDSSAMPMPMPMQRAGKQRDLEVLSTGSHCRTDGLDFRIAQYFSEWPCGSARAKCPAANVKDLQDVYS